MPLYSRWNKRSATLEHSAAKRYHKVNTIFRHIQITPGRAHSHNYSVQLPVEGATRHIINH
ncbi:MAG: hypothetical protein ACI4BH_01265 [Muribaculaceae bacterium]